MTEIETYNDEKTRKVDGGITNSAGMCQHLIGNSSISSAELGQSGYVRQRDLEFSTTGASRESWSMVSRKRVPRSMRARQLTAADFEATIQNRFCDKQTMTTGFLDPSGGHLNWHPTDQLPSTTEQRSE